MDRDQAVVGARVTWADREAGWTDPWGAPGAIGVLASGPGLRTDVVLVDWANHSTWTDLDDLRLLPDEAQP